MEILIIDFLLLYIFIYNYHQNKQQKSVFKIPTFNQLKVGSTFSIGEAPPTLKVGNRMFLYS